MVGLDSTFFSRLFHLMFLAQVLLSCEKSKFLAFSGTDKLVTSSTSSVQDIEDFLVAESDGNFFLYCTTFGSPTSSAEFNVMGSIIDPNTRDNLKYGDLNIGASVINIDPASFEYNDVFSASYFGQTVEISLKESGSSNLEFSVDLYFPEAFDYNDISIPNPLEAGSVITWNDDTGNDEGIFILIEANLGDYLNDPSSWDIHGDRTERMIYVEDDDGSYTITADDLQGLNNSSSGNNGCLVSLMRGDHAMVYNANNSSLNSKVLYQLSSQKTFVEIH